MSDLCLIRVVCIRLKGILVSISLSVFLSALFLNIRRAFRHVLQKHTDHLRYLCTNYLQLKLLFAQTVFSENSQFRSLVGGT